MKLIGFSDTSDNIEHTEENATLDLSSTNEHNICLDDEPSDSLESFKATLLSEEPDLLSDILNSTSFNKNCDSVLSSHNENMNDENIDKNGYGLLYDYKVPSTSLSDTEERTSLLSLNTSYIDIENGASDVEV